MTALAVAAQRSSLKTFTRLLEGKAQTDLKDNVGRLPIHHAASSGGTCESWLIASTTCFSGRQRAF